MHPWHHQWTLLIIIPLWVQHMGAPEDALLSFRILRCDVSFYLFVFVNVLSYPIIMKARFYPSMPRTF